MKHSMMAAALVCMVLAAPGIASAAIMINFDDLSDGTILHDQYAALGVVFSNSDGDLIADEATPGPPFTSPIAIFALKYPMPGNKNRADFSVPVGSVSVTLGDHCGVDRDEIYLRLYDSGGSLVASDSATLPSDLCGGITLSATSANPDVAYAEFWGVGSLNNSVYFDNFSFAPEHAPEPSTFLVWSVLGALALTTGCWRRRR